MAVSPRRRARELTLQGLYAEETGQVPPEEIVDKVIVDESLSHGNLQFARTLFAEVRRNREWTNQTISRLATNWDLKRIALIDQIILRMAMTELKDMVDVPVKVVLNEAIELAKTFSTAESSSFINGILDSFIKDSSEHRQA